MKGKSGSSFFFSCFSFFVVVVFFFILLSYIFVVFINLFNNLIQVSAKCSVNLADERIQFPFMEVFSFVIIFLFGRVSIFFVWIFYFSNLSLRVIEKLNFSQYTYLIFHFK